MFYQPAEVYFQYGIASGDYTDTTRYFNISAKTPLCWILLTYSQIQNIII